MKRITVTFPDDTEEFKVSCKKKGEWATLDIIVPKSDPNTVNGMTLEYLPDEDTFLVGNDPSTRA